METSSSVKSVFRDQILQANAGIVMDNGHQEHKHPALRVPVHEEFNLNQTNRKRADP